MINSAKVKVGLLIKYDIDLAIVKQYFAKAGPPPYADDVGEIISYWTQYGTTYATVWWPRLCKEIKAHDLSYFKTVNP